MQASATCSLTGERQPRRADYTSAEGSASNTSLDFRRLSRAVEPELERELGRLRFPVLELCGPAWQLRGRLSTLAIVDPLDRDLIGLVGQVTMEYGDASLEQGWRRVTSMARVSVGARSVAPADRLYSDETSDDARARSGMGEVLGLSRLARAAIEPTRHGRPSGLAYEDACAARPEPAIIEVDGVAMHGRCAACDGAFAIALSVPDGAVVVIGTGTRGEIALRSVRDLNRRRRSS